MPDDLSAGQGLNAGQGDGAASPPLSDVIAAVVSELDTTTSDLQAICLQLRQQELPEGLDVAEAEMKSPRQHVRKIAADLEMCATALRETAGEAGETGFPEKPEQ